jgi:AcrR family transcriptional regulator
VPARSTGRLAVPPLPDTLPDAQRDRRERIIDACLSLLSNHDHAQIQMKDVAVEADAALGTVYRYFQSKDHLLAEALDSWGRKLRTNVDRRPLRGETNAERLTDVLSRSLRAFQAWPQMVRVVMALESSEDAFVREIFDRNNARNMAIFGHALRGLPDDVVVEIIRVAAAVFDLQLRRWAVGAQSIVEAYERIGRAVEIILEFDERAQPKGRRPRAAQKERNGARDR